MQDLAIEVFPASSAKSAGFCTRRDLHADDDEAELETINS